MKPLEYGLGIRLFAFRDDINISLPKPSDVGSGHLKKIVPWLLIV